MIWLPWLLLLNAWTFAAFGIDKSHAIQGQHGYRESDLLLIAMVRIGAAIGLLMPPWR